MRIIASYKKEKEARFVSHLDVQRILHRTMARANIPVAFSAGFNPHPLLSFAAALGVGQTGENEWIDIKLSENISAPEFIDKMNAFFPIGFSINAAFEADDSFPSLSKAMKEAQYVLNISVPNSISEQTISDTIKELYSGEIIVTKKKKDGKRIFEKQVDLRPDLYEIKLISLNEGIASVAVLGRLDCSGGLNADLLCKALCAKIPESNLLSVHRKSITIN